MRRLISGLLLVTLCLVSLFEATAAALSEDVKVAGTSFTIGTEAGTGGGGNTALKFLVNVAGAIENSNLSDSINGPSFGEISSTWTDQMELKVYNKGTKELNLITKANYINDPNTLRDDIFVNVLAWDDVNNNGQAEASEVGQSYGYNTILRLKNDTFPSGSVGAGEVKGFVLRFDGTGVSEANFGQSAVYDFIFTGMEVI